MSIKVQFADESWAMNILMHNLTMSAHHDSEEEAVKAFIAEDERYYGPWLHSVGSVLVKVTHPNQEASYWRVTSELKKQLGGYETSVYTARRVDDKLDGMITKSFVAASDHPRKCRCALCLDWWESMSRYPDDDDYGPFTKAEVEDYRNKKMFSRA